MMLNGRKSWYEHKFAEKSSAMKEVHQERKVQSIVDDLEEL